MIAIGCIGNSPFACSSTLHHCKSTRYNFKSRTMSMQRVWVMQGGMCTLVYIHSLAYCSKLVVTRLVYIRAAS